MKTPSAAPVSAGGAHHGMLVGGTAVFLSDNSAHGLGAAFENITEGLKNHSPAVITPNPNRNLCHGWPNLRVAMRKESSDR